MTDLNVTRESDTHLRIEFRDGTGHSWIRFNALQVDQLIHDLGQLRGTLTPEVPQSPQMEGELKGEFDPKYFGRSNDQSPERFLSIRHHGLGWLLFGFPQHEAKRLAAYLSLGVPDMAPTPDHRRH